MKLSKIILSITAAVVFSACGGPPSEDFARKQLEAKIQSESQGFIKLVSFAKTDGMERDFMGQKRYEMNYTAEIEFLQDCGWAGSNSFDNNFRAYQEDDLGELRPEEVGRKKAHANVSGTLGFEKAENGWRPAYEPK